VQTRQLLLRHLPKRRLQVLLWVGWLLLLLLPVPLLLPPLLLLR
jgi:hypothetical protein